MGSASDFSLSSPLGGGELTNIKRPLFVIHLLHEVTFEILSII